MDDLLTNGLKHIDAAYYLAEKLVDAKMAPHRIGMGCFVYDKDDMHIGVYDVGKTVTVRTDRGFAYFDLLSMDEIVAECVKLGFTSGSVTKDDVVKHREVVEKAWRDLCQSLSTLKAKFTYDPLKFLFVNYEVGFRHDLNLCFDRKAPMHILVQLYGRYQYHRKPPSEAASTLRLLHDFAEKEKGE